MKTPNSIPGSHGILRQILRAKDVATMFGLSPQRIYALAAEGSLPCLRIGRAVYFPKKLIEGFLNTGE